MTPAEAKRQRIAGYRRLSLAELDRIHLEQSRRLAAGRAEERAIFARWAEVHHAVDSLSVTTQEIEQVIVEKMGDKWPTPPG